MRDIGVVERGSHNGVETLGIRLSWEKRYITLGPKATLVGLAFQLFDPEGHLGKGEDLGITVAIIPADHPGVEIGRRHLPTSAALSRTGRTGAKTSSSRSTGSSAVPTWPARAGAC